MNVTQCAPAPARGSEPEHQFSRRPLPSRAATIDGDGEIHSPFSLSVDDFSTMQVHERSQAVCRRKGIPDWTRDDATVRAVLVSYFEHRAFGKLGWLKNTDKTEAERLRLAVEKLQGDVPSLIGILDRLCHEYCMLHGTGSDSARQRILKSEIEGIDATLRLSLGNGPATVLGIIYRSYRRCEDSVAVGAALAVKPPTVRQILYRLNHIYRNMELAPATPTATPLMPTSQYMKLTPEQRAAHRQKVYQRRKEQQAVTAA